MRSSLPSRWGWERTEDRLREEAERPPSGCTWCGRPRHGHFGRWSDRLASITGQGWHDYEPPNSVQIKGRMHWRRLNRGLPVPTPWGPVTR